MGLNRFLNQTCTIKSLNPIISNDGNIDNTPSIIYQNIKCFLYMDKRSFNQNQRATEDQNGLITLMIERNKTNIRLHNEVEITDPELGTLGKYRISRIDLHRSFSKIGGITLILNKIEDGES